MGIPHLYTFAAKKVKCLFDIHIIQEIDNWSRQNDGSPTIVIDFISFCFAITVDPLDSFFSRRNTYSITMIEEFLSILREKGVNLVFFEDGPLQSDKSNKVINDQTQAFETIFQFFDDLYKCNIVKNLMEKYTTGVCLIVQIKELARKFGKFYVSYHNECDKEIVAYATKVNAMAIISDDTDYLIFKGNWNYWSSKHLNFKTMTTKQYNKSVLQQYLKLSENEMPLLATLAGNDLISRDLLDRFHRFLGNPWNKFQNISKYIIKHFRKLDSYEPEYIAKKVFGNVKEVPEYTELVRKSLNSYNVSILNENNDDQFMQRMKNLDNDCYAFLLDLAGSSSISNFDVRTPEFEKYPSAALDLIRRQLGIVLQHKNDNSLTRHIYCYQDKQYAYITIHPEYPTISVPNLDDFYNPDKNDELKNIKLQLLAWVLSDHLDFHTIMDIDKKYFCACLTLYFLVNNVFISTREADIFLHMIDTVNKNLTKIIDLPPLETVNPRTYQLIFLFNSAYTDITEAVANCSLFELIEHNNMDGLYFHYAYNKMWDSNEPINIHLEPLRLYAEL